MTGHVLWHNTSTNESQYWIIVNGSIFRRATVLDPVGNPAIVGSPFSIVGADMNWIFWYNSTTFETQQWTLSTDPFVTVVRRRTVVDEHGSPLFVAPPWQIVGVSTSGDSPQIWWYNRETGETQVWVLGSTSETDFQIVQRRTILDENHNPIFIGPPYRIVGVHAEQLTWHNDQTGEIRLWTLVDYAVKEMSSVVNGQGQPQFIGPPWSIKGTTHFGPSTAPDILWYNPVSKETQIWLMTHDAEEYGSVFVSLDENLSTPFLVGAPWEIVACGQDDWGPQRPT